MFFYLFLNFNSEIILDFQKVAKIVQWCTEFSHTLQPASPMLTSYIIMVHLSTLKINIGTILLTK